jgi:hypothetical protein
VRREAGADLPCEVELAALVVADEQGLEADAGGLQASDHEFLASIELDLQPGVASLSRFVD